MTVLLILVAGLWLAYGNGANDNFKGVATLYGSDTTTYRSALWWANLTTFAGSATSIVGAHSLVTTFSGKGLVDDSLAGAPQFALAVGLSAGITVFIATKVGMPTSTTHALIGGLLGAGLTASTSIQQSTLISKFALPMLSSPLLAILTSAGLYMVFTRLRTRLGITKGECLCIGRPPVAGSGLAGASAMAASAVELEVALGNQHRCIQRYEGAFVGISAQSLLDSLHYLSAGAVCFSRAVNDTPKIAAVLLVTTPFAPEVGFGFVGLFMVLGGIVHARRVAETMSKRITPLNTGQGFTANLTTAGLVLFASRLGVPVSTTHVSCGSIFGIGTVNRSFDWSTVASILTAWVTTLPVAALIAGLVYWMMGSTH